MQKEISNQYMHLYDVFWFQHLQNITTCSKEKVIPLYSDSICRYLRPCLSPGGPTTSGGVRMKYEGPEVRPYRLKTYNPEKSVLRERPLHGKSVRHMERASRWASRTLRERPRNNYAVQKMMGRSKGRSFEKLRYMWNVANSKAGMEEQTYAW